MSTKIFITFTCKMRSLPTLFRYVEKTTVKTGKTNLQKKMENQYSGIFPELIFNFTWFPSSISKVPVSDILWKLIRSKVSLLFRLQFINYRKNYCKSKAPMLTVRIGVEFKIISTKKNWCFLPFGTCNTSLSGWWTGRGCLYFRGTFWNGKFENFWGVLRIIDRNLMWIGNSSFDLFKEFLS